MVSLTPNLPAASRPSELSSQRPSKPSHIKDTTSPNLDAKTTPSNYPSPLIRPLTVSSTTSSLAAPSFNVTKTPPFAVHKTPPTPDGSEKAQNQESGYFSHRRRSSISQPYLSGSDNFSTLPCLSPPAASLQSLDTDFNSGSCSIAHSAHLSPPLAHRGQDHARSPYNFRRRSSEFQVRIGALRRAKTLPYGRECPSKGGRKQRKCRHRRLNILKKSSPLNWSLPGCQLAPTAPVGDRELCSGLTGGYTPRTTKYGVIDTHGRLLPKLRAGVAPPLITRRWSSVEVGSHPVTFTARRSKTPTSVVRESEPTDANRKTPPSASPMSKRDSITKAVRDRLKLRRISGSEMDTPTSITLRRASGIDGFTLQGDALARIAGTRSRIDENKQSANMMDPLYLITSQDIDFITEVIETNLSQNRETFHSTHSSILSTQDPANVPQQNVNTPTITSRGLVPVGGRPVATALTNTQVSSSRRVVHPRSDHLQTPATNEICRTPEHQFAPASSPHEVIWKANELSSLADKKKGKVHAPISTSSCSTTMGQPTQVARIGVRTRSPPKVQQRASFVGWPFSGVETEESGVPESSNVKEGPPSSSETSSDDFLASAILKSRKRRASTQPPDSRTKSWRRENSSTDQKKKSITYAFPQLEDGTVKPSDAVSFPPLAPRKTTNDWRSPLPDLPVAPPSACHTLYGMGLDITCPPPSWARVEQIFPRLSSLESVQPSQDLLQPGTSKPVTPTCRRRSSAPEIIRVFTVDNVHKGERDHACSKWRPPSICPPRRSPSGSEYEDAREQPNRESSPKPNPPRKKSGFSERMIVIASKTPPTPKIDCVGIYGQITGSKRSSGGTLCDSGKCLPLVCDESDDDHPSVDWIG